MRAPFQRDLFLLALRRTLSPPVLAVTVLLALWLALGSEPPPALMRGAADDPEVLARGLARQRVWTGLLLWLLPLAVFRGAATVGRWRAGEVDWLASCAAGRTTCLVSTWAGQLAGALLLLAFAALAVEARAGRADGPSYRLAGRLLGLEDALLAPGERRRFALDDPGVRAPDGSRLSVRFTVVKGGGPAADVRLTAGREGAEAGSAARSPVERVLGRGAVEVDLPPGPGALVFEVEIGGDALVALRAEDGIELWAPVASERAASLSLWLSAGLLAAASSAVALGLGAWMGAPTAALFVVCAWIASWLGGPAAPWDRLVGARLPEALELLGDARLPRAISLGRVAATLSLAAGGLALARAGTQTWRRAT